LWERHTRWRDASAKERLHLNALERRKLDDSLYVHKQILKGAAATVPFLLAMYAYGRWKLHKQSAKGD